MQMQQDVNHKYKPFYTPTKIGTLNEGSCGMQMAAVHLWYGLLHAAVFQTIGMTTQGKKNISDMVCMHTQPGVDHNPWYTPTKRGMITGGSSRMYMVVVHL